MNKLYLTWEDIENQITDLAEQISKSQENIIAIYGLPRGGLIPAVLLSHKLGVKYVNEWPLLKHLYHPDNVLIVDDICDSGKTLKGYNNYPTATLHYKPSAVTKPTFYSDIAEEDVWIVYPWENEDSHTIQDYKL
jgi:hypoxanthine phosphoribosyltransferase